MGATFVLALLIYIVAQLVGFEDAYTQQPEATCLDSAGERRLGSRMLQGPVLQR